MREVIFYPATKNEKGQFKPLLLDREGKPQHIYWKSQSFINIDAFTKTKPSLKKEDVEPKYIKYFSQYGEDKRLYLFAFSLEELEDIADKGDLGLTTGFTTIDAAEEYFSIGDRYERQEYFHWEICRLYPAEFVISLPKEKQQEYVRISHLDIYSASYTANLLKEILDRISTQNEIYILVDYSF